VLRGKRDSLEKDLGQGNEFFEQDLREQLASFEAEINSIQTQASPILAQSLLEGLSSKMSMLRSQKAMHSSLNHSRLIQPQLSLAELTKKNPESLYSPRINLQKITYTSNEEFDETSSSDCQNK
jgi:plasmid maintenance system killer protein